MEKTGLVLAGGGSRGAYEIGVWRALVELGEQLDVVTGSSVGALNGAMIAQGDYDLAEQLWREMETTQIFSIKVRPDAAPQERKRDILRGFARGGLDPAPLEELLRRFLNEDAIKQAKPRLGLVTVCVNEVRPRYLWADELPDGSLWDYLLASCALFPAIRSRKINGAHYIDGAFADNMPVEMALSAGVTRVIAVQLDAPGVMRKITRQDDISLRIIRSWWGLGSLLMFDPSSSRQNIRLGYLDAMRSFGVYDGCAYAFIKGSLDRLLHARYLPVSSKLFVLYSGGVGKALPPVLQKRLRRRGAESGDTLRTLALDGLESAGELFEIDPKILYSFERFEHRLRKAVYLARVAHPAELLRTVAGNSAEEDGGTGKRNLLLAGRQAATIAYANRLALWFAAPAGTRPPAPLGLATEWIGGLARGEAGFAAAVYLALSGWL